VPKSLIGGYKRSRRGMSDHRPNHIDDERRGTDMSGHGLFAM
jgi:hypothetical protein